MSARVPTPREMRAQLPSVEPNKYVAKIIARDAATPSAAAAALDATARKGHPNAAGARATITAVQEGKEAAPLAVTGAIKMTGVLEASTWMTPAGRYRMGPDGVPVKFKLAARNAGERKSATPRSSGTAALSSTAVEEGKASSVDEMDEASDISSGFLTPDPEHDTVLKKDLQLLVALVGVEAVLGLGLR